MESSWPQLGVVQNKAKLRGERTANSFAGALKKQSLPVDVSLNRTTVNVKNSNIPIEKNKLEFEEWKEQQKNKRQLSKREKKLRKEEEFRRQIVAPKGYRVQLVQQNIITTAPSTSTSEANKPPTCTLLETAFPTLGSPVLPRARVNINTEEAEEEFTEPAVLSKTAMKKRKLKDPIKIDLHQVLIQQKKRQTLLRHNKKLRKVPLTKPKEILSGNPLDSSQPTRYRGKKREKPKPKRPSTLKAVILKHRLLRRLNKEQCQNYIENICGNLENIKLDLKICDNNEVESKKETEKIIEDIIKKEDVNVTTSAADIVHSTRFRNYCDNMQDPSLDDSVKILLRVLVKLQDKAYAKDPVKAKTRKKMLTGLHEAKKALILKKVVLLIIAPDLEICPTPGGLDSKILELISLAQNNEIMYVFALGRRKLGHILLKKVPVSCVAIVNVVGAESEAAAVTSQIPALKDKYNRAMGKPLTNTPLAPEDIVSQTRAPDVNKIVVSSLLSALEESLQKPKLTPFLTAIKNVEDSD